MKRTAAILVMATALGMSVLAQAPSPAPTQTPEMKPALEPRTPRAGGMGERRWGGGPGGMENREFGLERLVAAIASGQEFGRKLNLTPEQQELIKRLVLDQRTKIIDLQGQLQKAALKQTEILMADPLDETALMAAVEETSKARTAIAKAQIQLLIDVRKVLTEEQRKQLREQMMQAKQGGQMPAGRPGEEQRRERRMGDRERGDAAGRAPEQAPAPAPAPAPAAAM